MSRTQFLRRNPFVLPALGLIILVAVVFGSTASFGFVNWDDGIHVRQNPLLSDPRVSWQQFLRTEHLGYPIPVTILSYWIDQRVLGSAPQAHHFVNVVLHALNSLLLLAVAKQLSFRAGTAFLVAALFALHPVVAEPVSWISGRKDLLAVFFCLLIVLSEFRIDTNLDRESQRPTWMVRFAQVALFVLALFSKPVTVCVLPILWGLRVMRNSSWRPSSAELIQYAVLGMVVLAYLPFAWSGQQGVGAVDHRSHGLLWLRNIWFAAGFHLRVLFLLEETSAKYLPMPYPSPFRAGVDLMPLIAIAIFWLGQRMLRTEKRLQHVFRWGVACAAFAYAPASNLIPLTRFLADAYLYLPLPLLVLALGVVIESTAVHSFFAQRVLAARVVATVALVALAGVSFVSSRRFESSSALWGQVFERYKDQRVCLMIVRGFVREQNLGAALHQVDSCIEIFGPQDFAFTKGAILLRAERYSEAYPWLLLARETEPENVELRESIRFVESLSEHGEGNRQNEGLSIPD